MLRRFLHLQAPLMPRVKLRRFRHVTWRSRPHAPDSLIEPLRALFDAEWYRRRHPECADAHVWTYFLEQGLCAGHNPNPLFDSLWYQHRYGTSMSSNLSSLEDWLTYGLAARRDPGPLFSTAWYLHRNPDVAAAGVNPLAHYLQWGWKENRDPSPLFDSVWYFAQYPKAGSSGLDARGHFLTEGAALNYSPCRLFNTGWYRSRYDSMLGRGENPLLHYLEKGAVAGLDPGPRFSTRGYLAEHPELRESGENPLVHRLALDPSRGAAETVRPRVVRPSSRAVSAVRAVIAELASIEPDLAGLSERLDCLPAYVVGSGRSGMLAWRRLYASLPTRPRVVVLAGNAEAAREFAAVAGLLIVVTDSETLEHEIIPTGANWRCLTELEDDLDMAARVRLIIGLVNGLRPAAVLVAGSSAGWEMLSRYGTALARHSTLFATDASSPLSNSEELLRRHFRGSILALSALYGKDPERLRQLAHEHGLPPSFANRLQPMASLLASNGFLATARLAEWST
jgi:hypothetical protein